MSSQLPNINRLLLGACGASFMMFLSGCTTTLFLDLGKDSGLRWLRDPQDTNVRVLANQKFATVSNVGGKYSDAEDKCAEAGFATAEDELGALHAQLRLKERGTSTKSKWVLSPLDADNFRVALLGDAVELDAKAKLTAYKPVEFDGSAKVQTERMRLVLAQVSTDLELTTSARTCVVSNICKDTPEGQEIEFVYGVLYGSMLRLESSTATVNVGANAKVPNTGEAKISLEESSVSIEAGIFGSLDPNKDKETFDVPQILEMVKNKQKLELAKKFTSATDHNQVIALKFERLVCKGHEAKQPK